MNLPNLITVFRFLLAIVFYMVMAEYAKAPELHSNERVAGLIIFIVASISDFIDGYIARKWNLITRWGAIMDPLADKTLALIALWFLITTPALTTGINQPLLMSVCALAALRELIILGGIALLKIYRRSPEIAPTRSGKWSTAIQFITLSSLLLGIGKSGNFLLIFSLLFLIWSGVEYTKQGIYLFTGRHHPSS